MEYPAEFERLYTHAQALADFDLQKSEADPEFHDTIFGKPKTPFYSETNLVGIMLVDPANDDVRVAVSRIDRSQLESRLHAEIWKIASQGAKSAKDIICQSWIDYGRSSHTLPLAAERALLLAESGRWISVAGILGHVEQFKRLKAEETNRRKILDAARDLESRDITATECFQRLGLLAERQAIHGH